MTNKLSSKTMPASDSDILGDVQDALKDAIESMKRTRSTELSDFSYGFVVRLQKMVSEMDNKRGQLHVSESNDSFVKQTYGSSIFDLYKSLN